MRGPDAKLSCWFNLAAIIYPSTVNTWFLCIWENKVFGKLNIIFLSCENFLKRSTKKSHFLVYRKIVSMSNVHNCCSTHAKLCLHSAQKLQYTSFYVFSYCSFIPWCHLFQNTQNIIIFQLKPVLPKTFLKAASIYWVEFSFEANFVFYFNLKIWKIHRKKQFRLEVKNPV